MTTVGSVGYALASAVIATTPPPQWSVYVSTPDAIPVLREVKCDSREDADALAAQLMRSRRIGSKIMVTGATVAPRSVMIDHTARLRRQADMRRCRNAPAYMPDAHRKVRASVKEWAGEKDGSRVDRTTERIAAWSS